MICLEILLYGIYGKRLVSPIKYFFPVVLFSYLMIFLNRGEEGSSASTIRKGSRKFAWKPDYMTIAQLGKDAELEIVYLETGRPNSSQDKCRRDHKKLIWLSKDSMILLGFYRSSKECSINFLRDRIWLYLLLIS